MRIRRLAPVPLQVALLAASLAASLVASPVGATATNAILNASVSPRVFSPNGDGIDDVARLHLELGRAVSVTVYVVDYAGTRVRTLLGTRSVGVGRLDLAWNGRTSGGSLVIDGGYRFVVRVSDGLVTTVTKVPFTKAVAPIYRAAPQAIVVALDAGHGGPDPGAIGDGFAEKVVTLDIVRRLRAMLEGAGVRVVMTRTGDTRANTGNVDWTGDGKVGHADELAARAEAANQARAAVFLSVHANAAGSSWARGTETFYYAGRSFASSSRLFATTVQARLLANLRRLRSAAWRPVDRGIHSYDFYVLAGYDSLRRPRPTLMPGVLAETLFISNSGDRTILRRAVGRQRLAIGLYEALVRYFAARPYGAEYAALAPAPGSLEEGSPGTLQIRVRNTSPRAWAAGSVQARLAWLGATPSYDGSSAAGTELARIPLPALAPGASVDLSIPFKAPTAAALAATGGRALLKLDLVSGSIRFAKAGVVPYQVPLLVTPAPAATPSAGPSDAPSTAPSPSMTASPAASPPSPSPEPTTSPLGGADPSPQPIASPSEGPSPIASPSQSPQSTPVGSLEPATTSVPDPSVSPSEVAGGEPPSVTPGGV